MNTFVQGIQNQGYDMEGLAKANAFLTSYNSSVMEQSAQIIVTINEIQAQLKTLSATSSNTKITKEEIFLLELR